MNGGETGKNGETVNIVSRESECFPRRNRGKHGDSKETKLTDSPRDHSLSDLLYNWKF